MAELAYGIRRFQQLAINSSALGPLLLHMWIDNLCIDQNNIPERSTQVSPIRKIYSRSARTLIWLGVDHGSHSTGWDLADQIYAEFRSLHPTVSNPGQIPVKAYSDASHAVSKLPAWDNEAWGQMKSLLDLPWFTRIWIVQEVVLSSRDPIIVNAQRLFPWHRLEWAAGWLRRNGYLRLSRLSKNFLNVNTISNIRRSQSLWPLDAFLSCTQIKFNATNQRDKVYAVLGIAAECENSAEVPEALRPDYSLETEEMYQRVARFFLERNGSLAILTRARGTAGSLSRKQRLHDLEKLPSWAPDWSDCRASNNGIRTSFSWIHYTKTEEPVKFGFPKQYSAAIDKRLKLLDNQGGSTLTVGGALVGEIVQRVSFSNNEETKEEFGSSLDSKIESTWNLAFSALKPTDEGGLERLAACLLKVTTADQHELTGRTWEQSFKDGLTYILSLFDRANTNATVRLAGSDNPQAVAHLRRLASGGNAEEYRVLAGTFCFNRCFIVTSTGHIGIGTSDAQVGDYASIIFGSGVLLTSHNTMLAAKRIVLQAILCCLLTLGLAKEDEKYDPADNFRPSNVTGLGSFYTWVGSYYNATAEVDVEFAYQYLTPSDEVCPELRNFTTTFKYDAILSVLESGTWNSGNNSVIFWLTLLPQTSSSFNVSSLPQDFMYKENNLSFPIFSDDPAPGGYWRPHQKSFAPKFNFTTTQASSGAYSLNGTVLNNGDSGSASAWKNITMPTCNSTEWTNDYRFSMTTFESYFAEDWDDYKLPEVSMQFDDKTANLTVDGIFYAKPYRQSNMTGQPVGGSPEVVGYVSVRFAGVVDEYHSDALSLNESTPSWERTVGFESNPSNIGYGDSDSSAGKMVSGSILTPMVVVAFVAMALS
ncbi:unnamed protein product [Fusarium graminearum]|uniref:Heterokaryon incompatibility domain-containing protein n=1 Tax=Gibberella zeae TaxID=5518 RepID=A0A9N8RQY7_GIBZA|nr:unnamed protein product [Fusarium graminearum]